MIAKLIERTLAPMLLSMLWLLAVYLVVRETPEGLAPVFAGLIAGLALALQALLGGERELRRALLLRPPVIAALAMLSLLGGASLALAFAQEAGTWLLFNYQIEPAQAAALLLHAGIVLGIAAAIGEGATRMRELI